MKKVLLSIVMLAATTAAMAGGFSWGIKGGLNLTKLDLDMNLNNNQALNDVMDPDNQTGFFIGPTVKFMLPLAGLGVDGAVLYDQRDAKVGGDKISQRGINVPLNLRYSIGLGSIASIHLMAGPQFGFNLSGKDITLKDEETVRKFSFKDSNLSLNLGLGATLIKHLEISASYNIPMGKTGDSSISQFVKDAAGQVVTDAALEPLGLSKSKNKTWQVALAYYF